MKKNQKSKKFLVEGKKWPDDYRKQAYDLIKNSGLGRASWYNDKYLNQDLDTLINEFEPMARKSSGLGFFLPIIKWFVKYIEDPVNFKKYIDFFANKIDLIIGTLVGMQNNPEERAKMGDIIKNWTLEEFEEYAKEIQDEIDVDSNERLNKVTGSNGTYLIEPIYSYREFTTKYGGPITGYEGKAIWCHANEGEKNYEAWTDEGKKMFFVLAKKNWKEIKPENPDNVETAYDDYGMSLIAILVRVSDCKLMRETLRWNHIVWPSMKIGRAAASIDRAFIDSYGAISEKLGFNLQTEIKKIMPEVRRKLNKLIGN